MHRKVKISKSFLLGKYEKKGKKIRENPVTQK